MWININIFRSDNSRIWCLIFKEINHKERDKLDFTSDKEKEPKIEIEGTEEIYGGDCGIPEFIAFENLNADYRKMMTCTNQATVKK